MIKNTAEITIKIKNNLSELSETTYSMSLNEMIAKFGDNETMYKVICDAQSYAKANGLDEEDLYGSEEEADFDKEDIYDGSSKIDLINSDEKFN